MPLARKPMIGMTPSTIMRARTDSLEKIRAKYILAPKLDEKRDACCCGALPC